LSEDSPDAGNPFVFIPEQAAAQYGLPGNVQIREDWLDFLTDSEWRMLMAQIAQYQPAVYEGAMSEGQFMADRASRKAKRQKREENKQKKKESKQTKRDARNKIKESRAKAKAEGRGADVLGSLIGGAKEIFGVSKPSDDYLPPDDGGDDDDKTDKAWYETTGGMIGIGAGILLLAGGGYALSQRGKQ
jgi:hypothetical protein